jgi:hypothetical protein
VPKQVSKYAKICPTHLTDGLFVPKRKKGVPTDIERPYDGGTIHFMGYAQLSGFDQSVLFAICARAGIQGLYLLGNKDDLKNQYTLFPLLLEEKLERKDAVKESAITYEKVTAYSLLTDIGKNDGKKNYQLLLDSLKRLGNIQVYREKNGRGGSMNMLSFGHDEFGNIEISLNWRLAGAILGEQQNVQVSITERLKVPSAAGKILHAWCSGYLKRGGDHFFEQGISYDKLCQHVWGQDVFKGLSKPKISDRRAAVKKALKEIGTLEGWTVKFGKTKAHIKRPKKAPWIEETVGTPGEIEDLYEKHRRGEI